MFNLLDDLLTVFALPDHEDDNKKEGNEEEE